MTSGRPISKTKRAGILEDLRAGKKLAGIARMHGVSPSAVKAIRIAEGLQPLPTPEAKASAAHARDAMIVEARRRRAALAIALLEDVEKIRQQLFAPATVFGFGGKDYEFNEHTIPQPDAKSKRELMVAIGIGLEKTLQIEKHDQESSAASKAAIIELVDRLGVEEAAPA